MQLFHIQHFQDSFFFLIFIGVLLLLATHQVCLCFFKEFPVSPLSGSVIMTFALYVAECLPRYKVNVWLLKLLMLVITVIWIYGSFSLLHDFFLKESTGRQSDRFGLSAWIISTALVAIMIGRIAPLQHGAILLFVIFALILWLKYAVMVCRAILTHFRTMFSDYVSASLFMGAAATASIAWMLFIVFQERVPSFIYQTIIVLACLLYVMVFTMWLSHYFRGKTQRLLAIWGAENSLIFGASAMIGMVSLTLQAPEWLVDVLWFWSLAWGVALTAIDIGHAGVLVAMRGMRKKLLTYDVKHWLRIFSYCMFYVFTWLYFFEHYSYNIFAVVIAEHGLNVITAIFLLQIIYTFLAAWLIPHDTSRGIE